MFSQSGDFSQSSNGDYNFLHNGSQNSSQFEFDGILNKNPNILDTGDLGIINEENPLSPMKLNYNNSKKSNSKYSFGIVNNNKNINVIQDSNNTSNIGLKHTQKILNPDKNKENVDPNKNQDNNSSNFLQLNFDSYKCQLSQQIDQVENASQSMNNIDSSPNFNKLSRNNEDTNANNNSNSFVNNISEEDLADHQRFNKYCADLIDNAMNKNLEKIENIKQNFLNSMDTYKMNFKTNAEVIKKLILLYSDDIFQKEKNKIIISHLTDQLLAHINSFFQEMNKFNNFNLNSNLINNNANESS